MPRQVVRDFGTCLNFSSASSQYVEITNNSGLQITGPRTVSLWVKLKSKANNMVFFSADDVGGAYFSLYRLQLNPTATAFNYDMTWSQPNDQSVAGTTNPQIGIWYHVVGMYDGTNMYIFVNGVQENSVALSISERTLSTIRIGNYGGNAAYANALIDDVRVYSTNLSSTQINNMYYGIEPPTTNLKGRWKLDDGSGTSATDSSGNGNTGTLINTPTWSSDVFMKPRSVAT